MAILEGEGFVIDDAELKMIPVPQFGKIIGIWVSGKRGRQIDSDEMSVKRSCLKIQERRASPYTFEMISL